MIFHWKLQKVNKTVVSLMLGGHIVWKLLKMSHLIFFLILAFSTIDLSGNTVWPQASGFQKLAKIDHFFGILINFCPLKM